jgi:hypothetical protein
MSLAIRVTGGILMPCFTRKLRCPVARTLWIGSLSLVDSTPDECNEFRASRWNIVVSPRCAFVALGLIFLSERE